MRKSEGEREEVGVVFEGLGFGFEHWESDVDAFECDPVLVVERQQGRDRVEFGIGFGREQRYYKWEES